MTGVDTSTRKSVVTTRKSDSKTLTYALGAAGVVAGVAAVRGYHRMMLRNINTGAPNQAALDSLRGLGMLGPDGRIKLLRERTPQALDGLENLLANGRIKPGSEQLLSDKGVNGQLKSMLIESRDGTQSVRAIERLPKAESLQEDFAWQVARRLGIDYLFPGVAQRAGAPPGTMMIEMVPGKQLKKLGIENSAQLEKVVHSFYAKNHPELGKAGIAKAARIDVQLLQSFDYILANYDRHTANAMADLATGQAHFIDNGLVAAAEDPLNPLKPTLQHGLQAGLGKKGKVKLDPETVEVLRQRLTPDDLTSIHSRLDPAVDGVPALDRVFLGVARSDFYRDNMVMRRNSLISNAGYSYDSNPHRQKASRFVRELITGHKVPDQRALPKA